MVKYLDPNDFYKDTLDDWSNNVSLYENVASIVSNSVFLPDEHIYLPLVCNYILMPTKWSRIAGILFCTGDEGSGKSTIANIANIMHGFTSTFSPADTFPSIRNNLDGMRWIDTETKEFEQEGAILCWDNISVDTLERDPRIYQLLLFGYSRKTDRISIAQPDGTNKEYFVYCPKILSSVDAIHLMPVYSELRRRLFIVKHKKVDRFTPEELEYFSGREMIDMESISWQGIEMHYYDFWNDESNCKSYASYRSLLSKSKKSLKVPASISSEKWTITVDLIATGLTTGCWTSMQEAIDYFGDYWEYSTKTIYGEWNAAIEHLREFIQEETEALVKINETMTSKGGKGIRLIIDPKKIMAKCSQLKSEGKLDLDVTQIKNLMSAMGLLGWKLTKKGWLER